MEFIPRRWERSSDNGFDERFDELFRPSGIESRFFDFRTTLDCAASKLEAVQNVYFGALYSPGMKSSIGSRITSELSRATNRPEYITCLDSLFNVPRARLREFCHALIERGLNRRIKWICYARADDLADESITALMKAAGAHLVQVGIESGDQTQLDNMDKLASAAHWNSSGSTRPISSFSLRSAPG
jgi:hypothetical protein